MGDGHFPAAILSIIFLAFLPPLAAVDRRAVAPSEAAIYLTSPNDGERVPGNDITIAYRASFPDDDECEVAVFFNGNLIHKGQEPAAELTAASLPIGHYFIEVLVLPLRGGAGEALASDSVEVGVIGDAVVAPEGIDDAGWLATDPHGVEKRLERARADEQASRYASAETLYSNLISQLANAPGSTTLEAMLGIGRVRLHKGDSVGSLLAFRDAAWHSPDSADAHAWISLLLKEDPCGAANGTWTSTTTTSGGATACRGDGAHLAERHGLLSSRLSGSYTRAPNVSLSSRAEQERESLTTLRVGILSVGSGGYARYFAPNMEAAEKYFLRGIAELHHYVFTDRSRQIEEDVRGTEAWKQGRIHIHHRDHDGWPSASMKRAHTYYENRRLWLGMDYVFAVDVDTRCVSYIGREILGDTVGTLHADNAFYDGTEVSGMNLTSHGVDAGKATMWRQHLGSEALLSSAVYERRDASAAGIEHGKGTRYFAGGLYGGKSSRVVLMLKELVDYTNRDVANGIVAMFHDESQINRYWLDNPPSIILTCAYLYPEPTPEACWGYSAPSAQGGGGAAAGNQCVRDHGHPWLWSPWYPSRMNGEMEQWSPQLWGSHRRFAIRLLNLSKDKQKLLVEGDEGADRGV